MSSNRSNKTIRRLIDAAETMSRQVDTLRFNEPVTHVYNPLQYAWAAHEAYLHLLGSGSIRVLFLGMNPGPWGMAQTGVPFGHVPTVRDWLQIHAPIGKPNPEHPRRPITGLRCTRKEVSGERLWGLIRQRFGSPARFFRDHFVANYCPLVFMEENGRNRTPDKLPSAERTRLVAICDRHLATIVETLAPQFALGVGAYAEQCLRRVLGSTGPTVVRILHPSPASPAANRGWAEQVTQQICTHGVW